MKAAASGAEVRVPQFVDLGALSAAASPGARLEVKLDLGGGLILHLVRA